MARLPGSLPAKWLVPAFLFALAHCVVAPRSADASCGDYVMLGAHGGGHSGMESSPTDEPDSGRADRSPAPVQRFPCSGPHCSSDAPRPLGVPPAPVNPVARHWGILEVPVAQALPESRLTRLDSDAASPRFAPSAVFRPPR